MQKGKLNLSQGNPRDERAEGPEFGRFSARFSCMGT